MSWPIALGLAEAAAAIRTGRLTSEALTRACLARIGEREPEVGAWAWLDADRALHQAREADAARRAVRPAGPLLGIPLGIKDIIHTRGIPTEMGSAAHAGFVPEASAAVVEGIEAAGAFVLGKTVTAELAYYTPGRTRNPRNPGHTPGGSSSGSAAAVAAGMVPGALGTQTNGSVIRPAAYCGVVGYKPSLGRVPRAGILPFSPTLDQVGVFARGVADAALLASVLMDDGLQGGDIAPRQPAPRLLAVRQPAWAEAEPAQQRIFLDGLVTLRRDGAAVEEGELPAAFDEAHAVHRTIMHYEAARQHAALQARSRALLSPALNRLIDEGLAIPDAHYTLALTGRRRLIDDLEEVFRNVEADAIITPPATGEAPSGLESTGSPVFCTIWSLTGAPALSLPAGLGPRGLPLGLQLVGRPGDDANLLAVAAWCEAVLGGKEEEGHGR